MGTFDDAFNFDNVVGGLPNILQILYYLLYAAIFGALLYFIIMYFMHNITVVVRYKMGNRSKIKIRRGRIKHDKDGSSLKVMFTKLVLPTPPSDAIDVKSNGKEWVEIETTDGVTGRFIYYKPEKSKEVVDSESGIDAERLVNDVMIVDFDEKGVMKKKKDAPAGRLKAFDSADRIIYADQLEQAYDRKRKSGWDVLGQVAPMIGVIIIFALALIFWEDIMRPMDSMGARFERASQNIEKFSENLLRYQELEKGIQVVNSSLPSEPIPPPE